MPSSTRRSKTSLFLGADDVANLTVGKALELGLLHEFEGNLLQTVLADAAPPFQ